jgi:hypothetical protein
VKQNNFKTYLSTSSVSYTELDIRLLTLFIARMARSTMHLRTSSDSIIRRICVRCGFMKSYSSKSIRASDSSATSWGRIGSANGWADSKEDFGAFMRLSLQSQRTTRAPGSNSCIIRLRKQRMKVILLHVRVAPFLGRRQMHIHLVRCTSIERRDIKPENAVGGTQISANSYCIGQVAHSPVRIKFIMFHLLDK